MTKIGFFPFLYSHLLRHRIVIDRQPYSVLYITKGPTNHIDASHVLYYNQRTNPPTI